MSANPFVDGGLSDPDVFPSADGAKLAASNDFVDVRLREAHSLRGYRNGEESLGARFRWRDLADRCERDRTGLEQDGECGQLRDDSATLFVLQLRRPLRVRGKLVEGRQGPQLAQGGLGTASGERRGPWRQ